MTVLGVLGFALIGGVALFFKFRSWCREDLWLAESRASRREQSFTSPLFPWPKPKAVDYARGIPPWNPAMVIALGLDPHTYPYDR